jgi:nitrate reductase assembly molybdenum cofactor insertion protein NarJ
MRLAAEARLISLLFERPREGWHAEVAALARESEDAELRAAAGAAHDASEGFHLAFLGNGGPVSPREVAHRPASDPGHVLAQLRALYEAFSFRPRSEEPLDHVAVLVGFLGYLRLKETFATLRGEASAETVRRAADTLVREHLALVAEPLALALERHQAGYLALAARALLARIGPRPAELARSWTPHGLEQDGACQACEFAGEP